MKPKYYLILAILAIFICFTPASALAVSNAILKTTVQPGTSMTFVMGLYPSAPWEVNTTLNVVTDGVPWITVDKPALPLKGVWMRSEETATIRIPQGTPPGFYTGRVLYQMKSNGWVQMQIAVPMQFTVI
jgi:hypothetical protein